MELPAPIGKYELKEFLGGGMSHVYRAQDTVLGRTVVVKILTEEGCADAETKSRFLQEARMAGNVSHDNIINIYDFGENEGRPFMVMEFLRGEDLRHVIKNGRTGDLRNKLSIALQIARALEYIHTQKIVHRDLKPENVHITEAGTVKLMDFGIAKSASFSMTRAGFMLGTPYYMAPEQVLGKETTDLVDVYAFGVLLFELMVGVKPISGDSVERIFYSILNEPLNLEPLKKARVPEPVCDLIERCTAKNPAGRPQSFGSIVREIDGMIEAGAFSDPASLPSPAPGRVGILARIRALFLQNRAASPLETGVSAGAPSQSGGQTAERANITIIEKAPSTETIAAHRAEAEAHAAAPPPPDSTGVFSASERPLPKVHLAFTSSPDSVLAGRHIPITTLPFRIGRSAEQLAIRSDPALSREHARIDWNGSVFTISDLNSSNGTYLNGRRLQGGEGEQLLFGSVIRLSASTVLTFGSDDLFELPDLADQVVGNRYTLLRMTRVSAKAVVYEARDSRLPQVVAIKILSPGLAAYPGYLEQFTREAEMAARLVHPHICKVLDHGLTPLRLNNGETVEANYVCMEMMEGGNLAERIAAEGRIPAENVVTWLDDLTDALDYAHRQGVVHAGLKTTSIVFDSNGAAYVTDFAIASHPGDKSKRAFLGAPNFLAPEQWEGSDPGHATDQYTLAVLTYLSLTGSYPFEGQQDPDIRQKNFARGPTPAHEQARKAGVELAPATSDVLRRALSVMPQDRYASMREFFFAFKHALTNPATDQAGDPRVFISYRRDSSAGWAVLFAKELKEKHRISVFVDTQRVDSAVRFPAKLERAIRDSDIFVCLLAKNTLRSSWVQEEIRLAWENGKPMIPVFQESFAFPSASEQAAPHIQTLISYDGVHLLDRRSIHVDHTIAELARMVTHSTGSARRSGKVG